MSKKSFLNLSTVEQMQRADSLLAQIGSLSDSDSDAEQFTFGANDKSLLHSTNLMEPDTDDECDITLTSQVFTFKGVEGAVGSFNCSCRECECLPVLKRLFLFPTDLLGALSGNEATNVICRLCKARNLPVPRCFLNAVSLLCSFRKTVENRPIQEAALSFLTMVSTLENGIHVGEIW